MNRITEKITKTAVMLFALCLTSGAWAVVKPIAVWNGDFDVTSRGGITLDLNNGSATENLNTVSADGKTITIGSGAVGGVKFTPSSAIANTVGIIVKYSNIAYSSSHILTFAGCGNSSNADYMMGSLSTGNAFVGGYYNNDDWSADNPTYTTTGTATGFTTDKSNYVGVLYSRGSSNHNNGTYIYTNGVSTAAMSAGGLHDSGFTSITKMIVGGYTDSSAYNFVGGKIHYVAILGGNQLTAADMATWSSLTSMTDSETVADGEAITGGSNVGVNLSTADMTATVSSATTAAAVFVQENATLAVSGSGSINIGDGTGPLYIADGKTLTIDLTSVTAPTAENPFKLLVKGKVFGATQINFTNVPANVITSVGEGGTVALLHNSVYTDLCSKWKTNGQKVAAWRTAGTVSNMNTANVNLVNTDTGDIGDAAIAGNLSPGFGDVAKAAVLYFDDPQYSADITSYWGYTTLGGLFVTAGGSSFSHSTAQLKLGDKGWSVPTYYVLAQSFDMSGFAKSSGNNPVYGNVNFTVYEGATLKLPGNIGIELSDDNSPGTTLKMAGGGCVEGKVGIKKSDNKTYGVTLDFSSLDASRATPFIQGQLTVNERTKFAFPSLSGAASYQMATSLNADATYIKTFTIGENEYTASLSFVASTGAVEFPALATLDGGETPVIWSGISWDAKPATIGSDTSVVLNIAGDTTLEITSAVSVNDVTFNIAQGATLTIAMYDSLTATEGFIVKGGGNVALYGNSAIALRGDLTVSEDTTITMPAGTSLALDGDLTVADGKTLTLAPAALTSVSSATLLTVDSMSGTVAVTTPEDAGNTYDVVKDATTVMLKRTPIPAFSYDAVPGGAPSGWGITSWCDSTYPEYFRSKLRVGPNSTFAQVYEATSEEYPWQNLGAKSSAFTFAVYVDVSKVSTTEKRVIASFGNKFGDSVMLYREGDYIKAAFVTSNGSLNGSAATVTAENGYHLYTVVCNPSGETPTLTLYKDGEAGIAASPTTTVSLGAGIGLGTSYYGAVSGFNNGENLAFAAIVGYDTQLTTGEIANLSSVKFPKTTGGTFSHEVINTTADTTLTVYSSTTTSADARLGVTSGTTTIPAGETVNVVNVRTSDAGTGTTGTLNINGTLNVSAESTNKDVAGSGGNTGVVIGWWGGSTTVNVPTGGVLNAPNAYLEIPYSSTATTETLDINGGTVKVKGIYANKASVSTVELRSGGVLEVGEIVDTKAYTLKLRYGTLRINSDATLSSATFGAASGNATTIDPHGNNITVSNGALNGSGDITVADSAGGGTVTFVGGSSYSGRIILTDSNYGNINVSSYTGTVLCQGTAAAAVAVLDEFAGTVYFTGNVDVTGVDLSGATVHIADDCTFTADAGKEGSLVLGSGVSVTLNVTKAVADYDGYIPNVSGNGTVGYYQTDGTPGTLTGDDHVNGNNLLPYYYVWSASATPSENTLSANASARWKSDDGSSGVMPASGKNVAFYLSGNTTITIDATITYNDVQVYGSGILTIQQSGDNVLTIGKALYTTADAGVQINSGLAFAEGTELVNASRLQKYVLVNENCGTDESPFTIPAISGSGTLYAYGVLATSSYSTGKLVVTGKVFLNGNSSLSNLQILQGGVVNVGAGVTLSTPSLTVQGTMNMTSTSELSDLTTLNGAGTVNWTGKQPDGTLWKDTITWTGTNVVMSAGTTEITNLAPENWGRNGSYIVMKNLKGYIDTNGAVVQAKVIFENGDNGYALALSNGYGGRRSYFREIAGSGTIKDVNERTDGGAAQLFIFKSATEFTGSIINLGTQGKYFTKIFVFSAEKTDSDGGTVGRIIVEPDGSAVIGDGERWSPLQGTILNGTLTLEGSATMDTAVTAGSSAKIVLSNTPITMSSTLTVSALEIDSGSISVTSKTTPVKLITGLASAPSAASLSNMALTGKQAVFVSEEEEGGTFAVLARLRQDEWNGDSATEWTASSFNGYGDYIDTMNVSFANITDVASKTVTITGTVAPGDVVFNASGTTYTLTGGTFSPSGTVTVKAGTTVIINSAATGSYVVESGATLRLSNASGVTVSGAGTLDIADGGTVSLSVNSALDDITYLTGTGTLVMPNNTFPSSALQDLLKNNNWEGTLTIRGVSLTSGSGTNLSNYGNNGSTVELDDCTLWYFPTFTYGGTLKVTGTVKISNGGSASKTSFGALSGSGTFITGLNNAGTGIYTPRQILSFGTAEDFTGSINLYQKQDPNNAGQVHSGMRFVVGGDSMSGDAANDTTPFIQIDTGKTAKLGDGATWTAYNGIKVNGTVIVAGEGTFASAATFGDGATLTFNDLSSDKKLTLDSTLTFANGSTVNLAFSADSDKRAFSDGKVIIDWTTYNAIPDGTFAFSDPSLANDWVLLKTTTGLKVYAATFEDEESGEEVAVSVEDNELKATITTSGNEVTLPDVITKLQVTVTENAIANITAAGVAQGDVVVKYGDTVTTGAYTITKDGNNVISFEINTAADAAVDGIKVKPEVAATTPMTMGANTTFSIKTIPGLYYAVQTGTFDEDGDWVPNASSASGAAVQATSASTLLEAPTFSGTVQYYKIGVGLTADDAK